MAAQEKAGWGHQQGPCRILPESVEDPSEGEVGAEETQTQGKWARLYLPSGSIMAMTGNKKQMALKHAAPTLNGSA